MLRIHPLRIRSLEVAKIHAPPEAVAYIDVPAMKAEVVHEKHVAHFHRHGHRAPPRFYINLRPYVVSRVAARLNQTPPLAPRNDIQASVALIHVH